MEELYQKREKDLIRGTIEAIQEIVKIRDSYTFEHMIGVSKIVIEISDVLGIDNGTTEDLVIAALLHDVGKVAVPAEILNKSASLNDAEWVLMKGHVKTGVGIVSKMQVSKFVIQSISEHHERLDGTGYPCGITDICSGGRILAVADVMDSMIRHRPYRSALKFSDFEKEVRNNRYDADVVRAAIEVIRKKEKNIWSVIFSNKKEIDLKNN